jgi:ribosomal 50S subunit-recycling heat shock protein
VREDGAALRMDVALHRLCLTRSRSEGKTACDAGAVTLDGRAARAKDEVAPGARIAIRYPQRTLELELLELPGKSTSRAQARTLYRILRDEQTGPAW